MSVYGCGEFTFSTNSAQERATRLLPTTKCRAMLPPKSGPTPHPISIALPLSDPYATDHMADQDAVLPVPLSDSLDLDVDVDLNLNMNLNLNVDDRRQVLFEGYSDELLTIAWVACIVFIIVGVPGNLLTIVALSRGRQTRNSTAIFIINLSCSDLLFGCFNLPLAASTFKERAWTHSDLLCRLFPMLRYGLLAVSLLSVSLITINRYIIIAHPRQYPRWEWACPYRHVLPKSWRVFRVPNSSSWCLSVYYDTHGNLPLNLRKKPTHMLLCFWTYKLLNLFIKRKMYGFS